jgi:hypothetical protein
MVAHPFRARPAAAGTRHRHHDNSRAVRKTRVAHAHCIRLLVNFRTAVTCKEPDTRVSQADDRRPQSTYRAMTVDLQRRRENHARADRLYRDGPMAFVHTRKLLLK